MEDPKSQTDPIRGIDVSRWQGRIDWNAVAASGIRFMYAKATEGATVVDDLFAEYWAGALYAGLERGAYHFLTTSTPAEAQAAAFLRTYPGGGELPPALDLERGANGLEPDAASALAWLRVVGAELGTKPLVYCSPGYAISQLQGRKEAAEIGEHALWVAHYGVRSPALRAPWTRYAIWQHGTTTVPGIAGPVDANVRSHYIV